MGYLQVCDNKDFVKELSRRINKGTINLNMINCCQLMHMCSYTRNNLRNVSKELSKDLPFGDHCFSMIDIFIPSLFSILEKEKKLCTNCLGYLEKVGVQLKEQKEKSQTTNQETEKKETNENQSEQKNN